MVNEMKALLVNQNSKAVYFMHGMEWMDGRYRHFDKPTFAEVVAAFPELLVERRENICRWGQGLYVEGPDGMPACVESNWDS